MFQIHVIVEPVFDHRTDPQLHFLVAKQALHCLSHQVGAAMAHDFQAVLGIPRNNLNFGAIHQLRVQINRNAVDLPGQRIFAQTTAD
ncbi:hypothetical protein D3C81_1110450 [compost metagenome]